MKKTLVIFLCFIILTSSLCSCGLFDESHPLFGDKTQICYVSYESLGREGVFHAVIYLHNLGNSIQSLPIGTYEVIKVTVRYGIVSEIEEIEIKIKAEHKSNEFVLKGFEYNHTLNENPPEEMQKLINDFIKNTKEADSFLFLCSKGGINEPFKHI